MSIAIAGAGRMGQAIAAIVSRSPELQLAGIWSRGEDLDVLVAAADVVIDFSLPGGTEQVLDAVFAYNKPLVCGVSGLDDTQSTRLRSVSEKLAIVFDRNMSMGVAVMERAVAYAAASLGKQFAVHVSEVHHVQKKDAPSGTALKFAEAIAAARGEVGTGAVQFSYDRRGEVPGDHEVTFKTATEELAFSHSVTTRSVFADGAVRAAQWVANEGPGLYSMADVLFAE